MDFSSKQALGVVVVIAVAALVIGAAVVITNQNNTNATTETGTMWNTAHKMVTQAGSSTATNPTPSAPSGK